MAEINNSTVVETWKGFARAKYLSMVNAAIDQLLTYEDVPRTYSIARQNSYTKSSLNSISNKPIKNILSAIVRIIK